MTCETDRVTTSQRWRPLWMAHLALAPLLVLIIVIVPLRALAQARPAAERISALGEPFATRHARFEPAPFASLPGWNTDALRESLLALRQSCAALGKKSVWNELCGHVPGLVRAGNAEIRRFFEQHFYAYSVQNPDRSQEGIITGYYEPMLNGSLHRSERYRYPVYRVPADLFLLDARAAARGKRIWLRIEGRYLRPASAGEPGAREYDIDLDGVKSGIRDKRYRVRIADRQILPYWSRQEIERRELDAEVIAWVERADQLYSMQIQGSGRIRLVDGKVLRVGYGEQNGHPFLPGESTQPAGESAVLDVSTMIAILNGERPAPSAKAVAQPVVASTGITDPSYVFFRQTSDGPHGPLGALGVPLTAGRSIAVDPRTTPLGYPVFVSAPEAATSHVGLNRLMFAQDTGGAIRGAVRADYFWGFGAQAREHAAQMKTVGRMWLFMPRGLQTAAMTASTRLRSIGGMQALADCVVPDPENCVEE